MVSGEIFEQLPLFQRLSPAQRCLLAPLFCPCEYYGGTLLFEQGDPADYLYLVVSGEVVIRFKPEDGPTIVLARVRPGGVVGWSAVLGRQAYTSGAECVVFSRILKLRNEDLRNLCDQYPETGEQILASLAGSYAERNHGANGQVIDLLKQGLAYGH